MSQPELQHYVPQFLLRNFCMNEKSQIHTFDKWNDNIFVAHTKKIASEKGFNDFDYEGITLTVEPALSELEFSASRIIDDILSHRSLKRMSNNDKETLSVYLAVQYFRTRQFREILRLVNDVEKGKIEKLGFDPTNVDGFTPMNDEDIKKMSIMFLKESEKIYPLFLTKNWMLFATDEENPFYISDNPLTLQNKFDMGPYGNLGLACHGIEIYLPLSSTITLGLYWNGYKDEIEKRHALCMKLEGIAPGALEERGINVEGIRKGYRGIQEDTPIETDIENVININSLQVMFATRFVFSSKKDFSLVEKMIQDNDDFRNGLKPTIQ